MTDIKLTDEQWVKIRDFLKQDPNAYIGKNEQECRRFVETVKWISRSGAQWRLLPAEYGKWNTVYKRFMRWCRQGIWERMLQHFADDPDMEHGMIDSTIVRAHPCSMSVTRRIVQGDATRIDHLIAQSQGHGGINTAYIERLNGTFRQRLGTLVRRTRCLARTPDTLGACIWSGVSTTSVPFTTAFATR